MQLGNRVTYRKIEKLLEISETIFIETRWLYCVECSQYSIRLQALGYMCTSCLLPAFDEV